MTERYTVYVRGSTSKQELSIEAQLARARAFVAQQRGEIVDTFVEMESGAKDDRPQLAAALALCRKTRSTLLVATLDRLGRSVALLSKLAAKRVQVRFVNNPGMRLDGTPQDRFVAQMLMGVAEMERGIFRDRVLAAYEARRARGDKLGHVESLRPRSEENRVLAAERAEKLRPVLGGFVAQGFSQRRMVTELNTLGIKAPAGGAWQRTQLRRVLDRLELQA